MKKTMISISISLIIVLGVVMLKNCFSYMLPNDAMGIRAVVAKKHVSQLFLGASAFRKGIDVKMLEEELPGESFVLTYNGNQPYNMSLELKEILEEGTVVDTVIADFNPSMINEDANLSDKRFLWDTKFSTKWALWKEISKREDASFYMFYDYFVLSNNEYMITYPIAYPLIAERYYRGGSLDDDAGTTEERLLELEVAEKSGFHKLQEKAIMDMISICDQYGVKLIFVESPRYIKMAEDANYKEKSKALAELLEASGIEYYCATDLDFDNKQAAYYTDLVHMSGEGKRLFTSQIIQHMKENEK